HIAEIMANQVRYQKLKKNKEDMFVKILNEAEDPGAFASDEFPVRFDKDHWDKRVMKRPGYDGIELGKRKSPKEMEIERSLNQPISFDFKNVTLFDALDELHQLTGINVVPDTTAMSDAGIRGDTPLTLRLEAVSLKSALNILLGRSHLTYVIKDEVLQITTPDKARGKLLQKTYPVADLVIPVENFTLSPNANLQNVLDKVSGQPGMQNTGAITPYTGPRSLQGGQPVGSPGESALQSSPLASALSPGAVPRKPGQTLEEALIKLITNTIEPRSWSDMGGPGTIDYFPLGMALVINQTPDIQEQVQELLNALRRLQDLEVAIEVRFISLSESFYERIGLDFLMEIQPDTTKFEPQITSGVFKPPGYVNDFSPTNFVAGITPPGTAPNQSLPAFTHDLDIPIKATSFLPAVPPFGGFPIAPGADGGVSLGLAFLSDIQVFLFLEAAQGDTRTNIMQAPKLTMFNAQTATITINDTNFFVTGNIIGLFNGQVVFNPQNTPFPLGVTMTLQPVVSADRRFVRVSLAPTLTNLTTPIAALFPFTTIVTPIFDTGVVGQPIPITQFIQQPSFTTVGVQTTVSVPDGGTVLLGGLKTLQEGRNEFGPPILSKLPYINRLFKNVGYGRNVTSHLIMVTPRIIINEEEEGIQTGVGAGL
ncbi:MAG: type II secretion system protein GspD, partial [Gemmataceae bacterium]